MAITFFGSASTPTDGAAATNTSDPTVVTPPGSMTTGDLVLMFAIKRAATGAIAMSGTGGQTWNSETVHNGSSATLSANLFWCRYNGSWPTNPSVSFSSTTNNIAVMLVFRPTNGGNSWAKDTPSSGSANSFTSFAAAATITNTGWTPTNPSNVCIAFWATDDDNTWGTLSGANWVKTSLSAQYRNTSGNDTSMSLAYQIQTAAAATNNVAQTEATNGNDPGIQGKWCFFEGQAFSQPLSDSVTPSDSTEKASIAGRSDSVTTTDSNAKSFATTRTDSITPADVAEKNVTIPQADTVTASDTAIRSFVALIDETIGVADALTKALTIQKSDTITANDSLAYSLAKVLEDLQSIADDIVTDLQSSGGLTLNLSDGVTVEDLISTVSGAGARAGMITQILYRGFNSKYLGRKNSR